MGLVDNIKQSAKSSGAKIQSSDAAQLEAIFNRMFFLPKQIDKEVAFLRQVMTRGQDTAERVGLHASNIIVSDNKWCLRQQVLSLMYKQLQGEQYSTGLKRVFVEGDSVHEKWQRLMIRAGYAEPEDLDRTRFNKKYRVSYTPDGIIYVPEFYDGKMVLEVKSVNTFQFQKMNRHPSAFKQCQFYMLQEGIKKGVVLCEDKNTQDFKLEVYDFMPDVVSPFEKRLRDVKSAYKEVHATGKMVPRPSDAKKPDCKRCSECPMRDACWNVGQGRVRIGG